MSMTASQASEFLAGAPVKFVAAGERNEVLTVEKFQACCNDLTHAHAVPWSELFVKALAIYSIVTGAGTLAEKLTAIYALFSKVPSPSIIAG